MSTSHTPGESTDVLQQIVMHLAAVDALMRTPEAQARIGAGLEREMRYPLASFRQRYPDLWPGAQVPLL